MCLLPTLVLAHGYTRIGIYNIAQKTLKQWQLLSTTRCMLTHLNQNLHLIRSPYALLLQMSKEWSSLECVYPGILAHGYTRIGIIYYSSDICMMCSLCIYMKYNKIILVNLTIPFLQWYNTICTVLIDKVGRHQRVVLGAHDYHTEWMIQVL